MEELPSKVVPWVECDNCGDYICNIHGPSSPIHVYDCACSGIEDWVDAGLWPYEECDMASITALLPLLPRY